MFDLQKIALYSTIITTVMGLKLPASAIPGDLPLQTTETLISLDFPDRGSIKTGSVGGGTRGACINQEQMSLFKPLVPTDYWVTTLAANPSLLLHIPKNITKPAELVVVDEDGTMVYNQQVELPQQIQEQSGILAINLPNNVLEEGKSYIWEFALICDPFDRGADAFYTGRFQRFSLKNLPTRGNQLPNKQQLENQLAKLQQEYNQGSANVNQSRPTGTQIEEQQVNNLLKQAEIYMQLDLWNETLQIIAQLREARPSEWQGLLTSIGIDQSSIVNAPLINLSVTENQSK